MIEVPKSLFAKCGNIAVHAERAKICNEYYTTKIELALEFPSWRKTWFQNVLHRSETNLDDACDFLLRLLDEYDQFWAEFRYWR